MNWNDAWASFEAYDPHEAGAAEPPPPDWEPDDDCDEELEPRDHGEPWFEG